MASAGKAKSIDNMNMVEICGMMLALGLSCDKLTTLDEMRSRLRTKLNQAEKTTSWSAGQAFAVLSRVKEEVARKRQALLNFYTEADALLGKMDEKMLSLLQKHIKNLKETMRWHEKQLRAKKYFLLFADPPVFFQVRSIDSNGSLARFFNFPESFSARQVNSFQTSFHASFGMILIFGDILGFIFHTSVALM